MILHQYSQPDPIAIAYLFGCAGHGAATNSGIVCGAV